jgi:hypothetical protein
VEPTTTVTLSPQPVESATITLQPSETPTSTEDRRMIPSLWQRAPILPEISPYSAQILINAEHLELDTHAFSVVGDCMSLPDVFMVFYDDPDFSFSDDYAYLQKTVDQFRGSFSRQSVSAKNGLSAPSAMSPLWADPALCESNESPVACELRIHRPVIVFINLGSNWPPSAAAGDYDVYMREIVETILASGALPVISTKADNREGDHRINLINATVAYDYDIPLLNVWRGVQDLPNQGLNPESFGYLSVDAWNRRSFLGLLMLNELYEVMQHTEPTP